MKLCVFISEFCVNDLIYVQDTTISRLVLQSLITSALTTRENEDELHIPVLAHVGRNFMKFIVSLYLLSKYPQKSEGELHKLRANLLSSNTLFQTCKNIKMLEYISIQMCSDFSTVKEIKVRSIVNCFEAVIGVFVTTQSITNATKVIVFVELVQKTIEEMFEAVKQQEHPIRNEPVNMKLSLL